MNKLYNILMYSHDTYGLGHIRRTMAIARSLAGPGVNILILTGSPIAGRYTLPPGVDFVRIPGMIKKSNTIYTPHSIQVDPQQAIDIRTSIILATTQTFRPDLFIVDKVPAGLMDEIRPALEWLRTGSPQTRVVLGLRDILDNVENTRREWDKKGYTEVLRSKYTEIWVYGEKNLYDPVSEYEFPEDIAAKTRFVGYIPRTRPASGNGHGSRKKVLVTTGGGGDGYHVLDTYLSMLERFGQSDFSSTLITGPFLPQEQTDSLLRRAARLNVRLLPFVQDLENLISQTNLVVSMGGYNTLCEILSQQKPALIIPRDTPREEQLIRARVFARHGLVDYIPWSGLTPETMIEKTRSMLTDPNPYISAMKNFPMTGLETMRLRLSEFRREVA